MLGCDLAGAGRAHRVGPDGRPGDVRPAWVGLGASAVTVAKQIQLTHLRALAAVAASGSLTRAADELGYSEPAVHLQLAALRRFVGGPVVSHVRGRMELTELGRRILPYANDAIGAVDQLVSEAEQVRANQSHVLRIGVGRGTGIYLFPRVAGIIGTRMPGTSFELSVVPGGEMEGALDENRVDVLITTNLTNVLTRTGRRGSGEYVAVPLLRYAWSFVASPDLAEAVDRGDLPEIRILLPEWAGGQIAPVSKLLDGLKMQTHLTVATHTEAAKSAALASHALAFVPRYTARHELLSGELVTCLTDLPLHDTCLHVGHRRPARHSDVHDFVLQLRQIRGVLRDLVTVPEILPQRHQASALASR